MRGGKTENKDACGARLSTAGVENNQRIISVVRAAVAAAVRLAGRALDAGAGDDADVQAGDDFPIHEAGRQGDLPVRGKDSAIDDCRAAVHTTAAARECDV